MSLKFPKGCTHVRIETEDGKHSTIAKADAKEALMGVKGKLTFLHMTKTHGKTEFTAFAGDPIQNPWAEGEVKDAPAPAPKQQGKVKFTCALLVEQAYTARQAAKKVIEKFGQYAASMEDCIKHELRGVYRCLYHHKKQTGNSLSWLKPSKEEEQPDGEEAKT